MLRSSSCGYFHPGAPPSEASQDLLQPLLQGDAKQLQQQHDSRQHHYYSASAHAHPGGGGQARLAFAHSGGHALPGRATLIRGRKTRLQRGRWLVLHADGRRSVLSMDKRQLMQVSTRPARRTR